MSRIRTKFWAGPNFHRKPRFKVQPHDTRRQQCQGRQLTQNWPSLYLPVCYFQQDQTCNGRAKRNQKQPPLKFPLFVGFHTCTVLGDHRGLLHSGGRVCEILARDRALTAISSLLLLVSRFFLRQPLLLLVESPAEVARHDPLHGKEPGDFAVVHLGGGASFRIGKAREKISILGKQGHRHTTI